MAISVVGTPTATANTNGGNVTFTSPTLPTLATGDLVIVHGGHAGTSATAASVSGNSSGAYTSVWSDATVQDVGVWYKVQGATPDTTITCVGGGNASDGVAYGFLVLRGAHTTTPMDATRTVAASVDAAGIVPATTGACVVVCTSVAVSDASPGTVTNYTVAGNVNGNDTADVSVACAYRLDRTGGVNEDPPGWSGFTQTSPQSVTLAIRPAPAGQTVAVPLPSETSHPTAGTPLTVQARKNAPVPQATVTDTAQAVTARHLIAVPQASETETAQSTTASHLIGVPQASETSTALGLVMPQTVAVPQVSETETAQTIGARHIVPVPQAGGGGVVGWTGSEAWSGETPYADGTGGGEVAQPVTARKLAAVGQAAETDTALDLVVSQSVAVGQVFETDTARPLATLVARTTETDTAQAVTAAKRVAVPQSVQTETAQSTAARKRVAVPQAGQTETAQTVTVGTVGSFPVPQVTESDVAQIVWASLTHTYPVPLVTEIEVAQNLARLVVVPQVAELSTAQQVSKYTRAYVPVATETDAVLAARLVRHKSVPQVVETESSQTIRVIRRIAVPMVVATDVANPITGARVMAVVLVVETDVSQFLVGHEPVIRDISFILSPPRFDYTSAVAPWTWDQAVQVWAWLASVSPMTWETVIQQYVWAGVLASLQWEARAEQFAWAASDAWFEA